MSSNELHRRLRLVSFTLFVPFPGIPHAGGEYVRRHLMELEHYFDIDVVAPSVAENTTAAQVSDSVAPASLRWLSQGPPAWEFLVKVIKFFRGVSLGADLELSFIRQSDLQDVVATADVIEFQWTESASLARRVRSLAPTARLVLVAHDIVSQRWQREARSGHLGRRIFYSWRAFFTKLAERRRFLSVDTVIVFSDKDAGLARKIAPGCRVRTVNPPLLDEEMSGERLPLSGEARSVLFTGAFSRPENHEAAIWLLDEIWPKVLEALPDARLVLAGAQPLPELQKIVNDIESVTVTGYVPDLAPYYRAADVFVAPLLHGAGVKFKNITAMLWGVPILTTPIGAEGIGSDGLYLAITSDPDVFACALVESLENDKRRLAVAREANEWAVGRYGRTGFLRSLKAVYL